MSILVKYKDGGIYKTQEYENWKEEGNYTLFYSSASLDSLSIIIPTLNVVSITVFKELENEKDSLESYESFGAYTPRMEY